MKETDCRKCCVCAFKEDLCNGDFCEKYYREGNAEDFEKLLPHWIPCSERLPEVHKTETDWGHEYMQSYPAVVYGKSEYDERYDFHIATYCNESDGNKYWFGEVCEEEINNVKVWMPLPEPYKEGEQNG